MFVPIQHRNASMPSCTPHMPAMDTPRRLQQLPGVSWWLRSSPNSAHIPRSSTLCQRHCWIDAALHCHPKLPYLLVQAHQFCVQDHWPPQQLLQPLQRLWLSASGLRLALLLLEWKGRPARCGCAFQQSRLYQALPLRRWLMPRLTPCSPAGSTPRCMCEQLPPQHPQPTP